MSVRTLDWARDADGVARIDASFTTDRVYRLGREAGGFGFSPPLLTRSPLTKF